jgi:hypothetical protein
VWMVAIIFSVSTKDPEPSQVAQGKLRVISVVSPPTPTPSPCGRAGPRWGASVGCPSLPHAQEFPAAAAGGVARQSPGGVVAAADLVRSGHGGKVAPFSGDGRRSGVSWAARGEEVGRPLCEGRRRPVEGSEDG